MSKPKLLDQVRDLMKLRNYSPNTIRICTERMRSYPLFQSHLPAFFCNTLTGRRLRHPNGSRVARPQGCQNNDELSPRIEQGGTGRQRLNG